MKRTLLIGGPGAGKTTRALNIMAAALEAGTRPDRIAFVSFTRAAVGEARHRAEEQFGFSADDLPYFRTLHSLAFRQLVLKRSDILGNEHLSDLAGVTGELITSTSTDTDAPAAGMNADPLLTLDHYTRTTRQSLQAAWQDHGGEIDWFRLLRFSEAYSAFRFDTGLIDFTDILERFLREAGPVPVDIAIVDEAQDFTLLQWAVAERAFANVDALYVAGDHLQSIHKWAGAADDYFLNLDYEIDYLPLSHRIPQAVFDAASEVASRVRRQRHRPWLPNQRKGTVDWVANPEEADLSQGHWLLLARTRKQLTPLIQTTREQGVIYSVKGESSVDAADVKAIQAHEALRAGKSITAENAHFAFSAAGLPWTLGEAPEDRTYTAAELGYDTNLIWHDALVNIALETREYYLACLRRNERLTDAPRIRIDTIHGSKGAEAANVLLCTDMTPRVERGYAIDPDSEHRVFYVGMTRASERLVMVAPQTAYGYRL
jgi:superfamily I DNA/RNA helicase